MRFFFACFASFAVQDPDYAWAGRNPNNRKDRKGREEKPLTLEPNAPSRFGWTNERERYKKK
jgi:hypothetical protein